MITRTSSFLFSLVLAGLLSTCQSPDPELGRFRALIALEGNRFDLWIRGGEVLDGLDTTPRAADVLVRRDMILYVGPVDSAAIQAERVIDARGRVVTPGFIDAHAHGDPLATPDFRNFLAQGVTTICLGQDGASPDTVDLGVWMRRADSVRPAVNIAPFAGHGTLRLLSGAAFQPLPDSAQMRRMTDLLRAAFAAGAYGLSTGLEYTPGLYAGEAELLTLARVVGQNGGLITSHMRNEDDDAIEASLGELLRQGQFCNVNASHLKVVYGRGAARAEQILALLDSARQAGPYAVTADVYPYTASYTGIGIVFPTWAKAPNDYQQVKRQRRAELLAFLRDKIAARKGPEATLFGTAPYAGKTLAQVAAEQGKPYEEVLLDIGPDGASGAYFVMDEALQARLLADPHVMVSSDGSPSMHHPRGYGSFARIIEDFVRTRKIFSLGEAVRKMSGLPARSIGIAERGAIAAGQRADLLVFDPAAVRVRADFTNPKQLSEGFEYVVVNGQVALEKGRFSDARYGMVLRKTVN